MITRLSDRERKAIAIRMARFSFCAVGGFALFAGLLSFDEGDTRFAIFAGTLGLAFILFGALASRKWMRFIVQDDY